MQGIPDFLALHCGGFGDFKSRLPVLSSLQASKRNVNYMSYDYGVPLFRDLAFNVIFHEDI